MPNKGNDSNASAGGYTYVPVRKPPTLPAFSSLNLEQRNFVGALMATLVKHHRSSTAPLQNDDHCVTRTFKTSWFQGVNGTYYCAISRHPV